MAKATINDFGRILDNIKIQFNESSKAEKSLWVGWLNEILDDLNNQDIFGTEGQNDPRGDNRND